jgi:predicted NBD/HSP70 family sugar kinase
MTKTPLGEGPAVPSLLRELNERVILNTVWEHGPVHRAEIARLTGLSKPTASLALESLVSSGLLIETPRAPEATGRAASFFTAATTAGLVLAVDIGSRYIRGMLTDLAGHPLATTEVPLRRTSLNGVLSTVLAVRDRLAELSKTNPDDVTTAVVGTPGIINPDTGIVTEPGFLVCLEGKDLRSLLAQHLGTDVVLENDVNLIAVGEQRAGHGVGVNDFAVLSVGSGLGVGLILQGSLHRGAHGAAGEVHFIPFAQVSSGPDWMTDPAAQGVEQMAAKAATRRRRTSLTPPYEVVDVFAAARAGDPAAREVIDMEARTIALYLTALSAVVDVRLVILAGGIGDNGDLLLLPVRQAVAGILREPPRVEASNLGRAAVLHGAASIGRDRARDLLFSQRTLLDRT